MIPPDVAVQIKNPWGDLDELVEWEPYEDLVGPLVDVTARGLRTPEGHLQLRRAWTSHYDLTKTAASYLNGALHIQDPDSLAELEIDEIILALFAVRRFDVVGCPVFYPN